MTQEYITLRGARENNLKNVSLQIPKRKITIFTGVSGSGKSSIVFDTIAAEARRQLNETFSTFVRNFLPRYAQPEADAIENLFAKLKQYRSLATRYDKTMRNFSAMVAIACVLTWLRI